MDCKATVNIGNYSRGGRTRGDDKANDHDMGCREKYTPFGIVNEDSGDLHLAFGSSAKTSDFIVDGLYAWWEHQAPEQRDGLSRLQIKADNGPESSGRRTQFLKRMVEFADHIGKPIQLLHYPPYHSKYNPVERCWGILEKHWNGAKLIDVRTMLEWAKTMTWKGHQPLAEPQPYRLRERHLPLQRGYASSRGPTATQPRAAQVGYSDSARNHGMRDFRNQLSRDGNGINSKVSP